MTHCHTLHTMGNLSIFSPELPEEFLRGGGILSRAICRGALLIRWREDCAMEMAKHNLNSIQPMSTDYLDLDKIFNYYT